MSFPLTLPFTLPTLELGVPAAAALVPIDAGTDGVALEVSGFRGMPRFEGVIRALCAGVQDLDTAALEVYVGRWLDYAEGVQLDETGDILDLPRAGWVDETYRALLRAQVLVLRSDGQAADFYGVLRAIGLLSVGVHVETVRMAAVHVTLDVPPAVDVDGAIIFGLLERATASGVRLTLEWPTTALAGAFTFDSDTTLSVDALRGFGDAVAGLVGGQMSALLASTQRA